MTATAAHRLQNLLTVIVSNAALLAARLPQNEDEQREFADLQSAARDASALLLSLGEAGVAATPPAPAAAGGEAILLVDDEEPVRRAAGRILERLGYTVYPAGNGEEALNLWRGLRDRIRLVITDVRMPRLQGAELARAIRTEGGAVPVLFASGCSPDEMAAANEMPADARFLRKPWTREELAESVRAALDGRGPAA
jgi:CheY-like chemotaxis protein